MSILVTGGTGSLGYSILSNLSGTNHDLYSFSDEQPQPWQKVDGVEYLTGDMLNFKDVLEMIQKCSPRTFTTWQANPLWGSATRSLTKR